MDFCMAHMYDPWDYYSIIVANLNFEDAKEILSGHNFLFCRYMVGTWSYKGNSETGTVTMTENSNGGYTVSGVPELPGGGSFYITNGTWQYQYDGSDVWIDYYSISISSKTRFTLYSYQSGITYTFSKNGY